ncbi:cell division protein FtsK [Streptomyces chrestomyceticus JCM 4735]|uniref:Cell division protein FtsK n=1 Tax=Streptomyces chrestomyceticus JCM 4735 TaxID=1306181 RepID=A0A7U9Q0K7_9ACTN|nr:ATP-binding protein [Streptomyces chrestomyceticus]GCD37970.1 cell division protein FtsK [Streptomyces chrestomyceticus JCM 4735]
MSTTTGHDVHERTAETTAEPVRLSLVKPDVPAAAAAGGTAPARRRIRPLRRVGIIATSEQTRTIGRLAVRHGMYLYGGARIAARRAWDGRTAARYERMMRAYEAGGKLAEAAEWEERGQKYRAARHQRRMDLLTAPVRLAKGTAVATGVGAGGLLALGGAVAMATGDPGDIVAPIGLVIDVIHWAFVIGSLVWGPAMMAAPALGLLSLWNVGRQQQAAPRWALPASERGGGEPITPSVVVLALSHLGISALRKAIKEMGDAGAAMLSPIALAGCGVEVDVTLPLEVSTEEIMGRRRKLAENLGRHEHELYISVAPAARTVRLWIADSGALDEPVPASPLVLDPGMTADYKNGRAPWGRDLRGDAALVSLYQKHMLVTGLSNEGKTASLRALALWLALDAAVEFRIGDLKGVGDWRMFRGLATVLIEGPTDDHVMEVTHMVEGAFEEMQRRLQAPSGTVFRPLVVIVDEAQVAYGSGARETYVTDSGTVKYGAPYGGQKAISRYFKAVKGIHDQGRAVNVTIWEGTQDPTDQNLPKRSREGNHIRASLVLGTESQAKMALGDAPVTAGAAPHKLRQGLDKGTLVVAGSGIDLPPGAASITVRTHFIDGDDAAEIADRAKALRNSVATTDRAAEPRDHLADISEVLRGEERVRTPEVLHRLKNLDEPYYREWDGSRLRRALTDAGEDTGVYEGYPVVHRQRVLKALSNRE